MTVIYKAQKLLLNFVSRQYSEIRYSHTDSLSAALLQQWSKLDIRYLITTFPSRVAVNVGKVARTPTRCPRGHPLRADRIVVRAILCSCGWHTVWRCHCGAVTHGPPLADGCSLLDGPVRVR
jgi:hypothetical protein